MTADAEAPTPQGKPRGCDPAPSAPVVTEAMVEAGAKAIWDSSPERSASRGPWESASNIERLTFCDYARIALTAAYSLYLNHDNDC